MKKELKVFFALLIFVISFFIFNLLEFELLSSGNKFAESSIFSMSLVVSFFIPKLRLKLLILAFFLMFIMMIFYLAGRLAFSNFSGSTGIGILTIVLLSYLPEIVKKGSIENL